MIREQLKGNFYDQHLLPAQHARIEDETGVELDASSPARICKDGKMIGKVGDVALYRVGADSRFAGDFINRRSSSAH